MNYFILFLIHQKTFYELLKRSNQPNEFQSLKSQSLKLQQHQYELRQQEKLYHESSQQQEQLQQLLKEQVEEEAGKKEKGKTEMNGHTPPSTKEKEELEKKPIFSFLVKFKTKKDEEKGILKKYRIGRGNRILIEEI